MVVGRLPCQPIIKSTLAQRLVFADPNIANIIVFPASVGLTLPQCWMNLCDIGAALYIKYV